MFISQMQQQQQKYRRAYVGKLDYIWSTGGQKQWGTRTCETQTDGGRTHWESKTCPATSGGEVKEPDNTPGVGWWRWSTSSYIGIKLLFSGPSSFHTHGMVRHLMTIHCLGCLMVMRPLKERRLWLWFWLLIEVISNWMGMTYRKSNFLDNY